MAREHVGAVADAKQQRPRRAVLILMHPARRMHDKSPWRHRDRLVGRAQGAAVGEAEVDLGPKSLPVVGADPPRFPASDRVIPVLLVAEDLFDVMLWIP